MHCVSSYPCELENLNFKKLENLKELSPIYGYSGHYSGIEDAIVAICNGAKYIEKHFTINKNFQEEIISLQYYLVICRKYQILEIFLLKVTYLKV